MPPERRLATLETHHGTVAQRAEALSREITLLVFMGRYDDAIRLMTGRRFEVWEGGSLSVAGDWTDAHILRGHRHRAAGRYQEALADYQAAGEVPENLSSDEGGGDARRAEIAYAIGLTHEAEGDVESARKSWQAAAAAGPPEARRGRRRGLSDQAVQSYYKALALQKLGRAGEAAAIFKDLVEAGRQALHDAPSQVDRSASMTDQQWQRSRLALAHELAGLGYLGLGEQAKAREELKLALQASPDHLGAKTALESLNHRP
jgi:tetratricopeptide (TPR) repeat protein